MSRQERVLAAVRELTRRSETEPRQSVARGFTTEEIARTAGVLRTNCSTELNALVRQGLLTKVQGRPARYGLASAGHAARGFFPMVEKAVAPGASLVALSAADVADVADVAVHPRSALVRPNQTELQDDFHWGVGIDRSLREAVQQAKMALTYPPHGMHVLLLGETGVGKSTFARRMHEYAQTFGVLGPAAPFVAFNCSEYASNPEILLDQLFGHAHGAYTGAHSDKPGLVEQAHNGLLFLDEVHRLPPQGQEMLFHLLDYGEFRRLGETQSWRSARVLLVAATTEAPESSLLSTFRRRIPVVIRLPALRDWSLHDRFDLVYTLCQEEARSLGRAIHIPAPALDILLFSRFGSNIGDLKNTIKLACARAFNQMQGRGGPRFAEEAIEIDANYLALSTSDGPNEVFHRLAQTSVDLRVQPDGAQPPSLSMLEEGSFYEKIDRLSRTLQELGFATEEILGVVERELRKQGAEMGPAPSSIGELSQFVGEAFFTAVSRAWEGIETDLAEADAQAVFLRVAMHLFGVARTARSYSTAGESDNSNILPDIVDTVRADSPQTYDLARKFLKSFAVHSGVQLPPEEAAIVAMLLRPAEHERGGAIGIVIALFGDALAHQMAATALRLTGPGSIVAVDIPFQTPPDVIDRQVTEAIRKADQGKGVLLLTDVPRFAENGGYMAPDALEFARILRPDLRTVVAALQVHRDGRQTLQEVAEWLRVYNHDAVIMTPTSRRVVWACCLTGKGTARAVERLIREALPPDLRDDVEIVPKELGLAQTVGIEPDDNLVAAVGSVNPGIFGIPFFSVESLMTREGIAQLLSVLYMGSSLPSALLKSAATGVNAEEGGDDEQSVKMEAHVAALLRRDLVFVNPELALAAAKQMWQRIETGLRDVAPDVSLRRETAIRFCLHMAYVIERRIRGDEILHPYARQIAARYPMEWALMLDAWQPVTDVFRLPAHAHEVAYLFELVFTERDIEVFVE